MARYLPWVRWLPIPILIIGLGFGLKLGWSHIKGWSFLKIRKIEIRGIQHISKEEILIKSGIREGMGIFDFALKDAVEGIKKHPWVKTVQISRQLPDQVLIIVSEKEPVAILILGEAFYLDSELQVFKRLIPGDDLSYPIFTGLTLDDLHHKNSQGLALVKAGIELWQLASKSKLFPQRQISEFQVSSATGLSILTSSGQKIILGNTNFEDKFSKLELLRVEMGTRFYLFRDLDLSREDRVVARFFNQVGRKILEGSESDLSSVKGSGEMIQ